MKDMKRTALIFIDALVDIDMLTAEQESAYWTAFRRYLLTGEDTEFPESGPGERNAILKVVWRRMRDGIESNNAKWEETRERRRKASAENGREGGRTPKAPQAPQEAIDQIIDAWNGLQDLNCGIEPVDELKGQDLHSMNRAVEVYGVETIVAAIERVRKSDYLQGKTSGPVVKWQWLMERADKVADGGYDNYSGRVARRSPVGSTKDTYGMQRDPQSNAALIEMIARQDMQRFSGEEAV